MKRAPRQAASFGRLCLAVFLAAGGFAAAAVSTAQARQPDVLLIAIDDMNDWVGLLVRPGEILPAAFARESSATSRTSRRQAARGTLSAT